METTIFTNRSLPHKIRRSIKPKRVNLSISLTNIQRVTTCNKLLPLRVKNPVRNKKSMKISLNTIKDRGFERSKANQ